MLLCAVGLLLMVTEVSGFGFDVANDTAGFALVALGSGRQLASGARGRLWWMLTGISAVLAAVVSLFTYGGLVSELVSALYVVWEALFFVSNLLAAALVAFLAMALRSTGRRSRSRDRALVAAAVGVPVSAAVPLLLRYTDAGFYGPSSYVMQLFVVVAGVLTLVVLVFAFLAHRPGR